MHLPYIVSKKQIGYLKENFPSKDFTKNQVFVIGEDTITGTPYQIYKRIVYSTKEI